MARLVMEGLRYRYGWRGSNVFAGLDWVVDAGTRTVLLGPNGAGKSTLLGVLAQVLKPRSGQIWAEGDGQRVSGRALRRSIAWMPQRVVAVPGLTVREQAAYAGWLSGMSRRAAWTRSLECLVAVGLQDKAGARAKTLSGGQLRRLGLAEALVGGAKYLLLDEPTAGMDPAQRERFRRLLIALPDDVAVVVSTHQVDDLHEVFDTVAILAHGQWRFHGTPQDFLATAGPVGSPRAAEAAYGALVGAEV